MSKFAEWTYDEFLAYLLLMGAAADLRISDIEREAIVEKVGEEKYLKIKRCFDSQNDAQHIETISELYGRFESQIGGKENLTIDDLRGKENLANALNEIIEVDERPKHVMDRYMMMMLKRIL